MHNDSQATVTNGTVIDTIPSNATITGALPAGLVNNGNGTLTWTVATLAAGADATIAYTVTVNAGVYNQVVKNVITPGPGGDCDTTNDRTCTTNNPTPHFVVSKTSNPVTGSTVKPGDTIIYTLHMHNDSQATVTNGTVIDTLPANADPRGALPAGLVNNGDGTLTWTVPTLVWRRRASTVSIP